MLIQVAACHLGAAAGGHNTIPFVLIQGPPGTGKTHTVKGILNVWHLVHYQRFYESLVSQLVPAEEATDGRSSVMTVPPSLPPSTTRIPRSLHRRTAPSSPTQCGLLKQLWLYTAPELSRIVPESL